MEEKTLSPHHAFFRDMMEIMEVAREFFQVHLPDKELVQELDWSTLALDNTVPQSRVMMGELDKGIVYVCKTKDRQRCVFLYAELIADEDSRKFKVGASKKFLVVNPSYPTAKDKKR